MFRKLLTTLALVVSAIAITACGGDNDNNNQPNVVHVPVQSISVKSTTITLDPSVTTLPIEVVFNPLNATNKALTYVSDNTSVLTVSENGTITTQAVTADSTATITITSADNSSATATVAVTVRATALGYSIINGAWEIYNAEGLKAYRDEVNKGGSYASTSAKLAQNITLDNTEEWTPIGPDITRFSGTFDGNGKTITGLNISTPSTGNQGLFDTITTNGKISNLGLISPNIIGNSDTGAIAGRNDGGAIIACYVSGGTIEGSDTRSGDVGGIVGDNGGAITASYVIGSTIEGAGSADAGGIAGSNDQGIITASYVSGTTITNTGSGHAGGIIGRLEFGPNYIYGVSSANFYNVTGDAIQGVGINTNTYESIAPQIEIAKTTDVTDNMSALNKAIEFAAYEYYKNGDTLAIRLKEVAPLPSIVNGYYEVNTANELIALRDNLNFRDVPLNINIKLMNNITLDANEQWIPIMRYTGIFDGNGKTITGLMMDRKAEYQALFSRVDDSGEVKNLGLINPSIKGARFVAGIIAYGNGENVTACYVSGGTIEGTGNTVGGIVAHNYKPTITASYVSGVTIKGVESVGGIVGSNGSSAITASYVTDSTIEGTGNLVGGITGSSRGLIARNYVSNSTIKGVDSVGGITGFITADNNLVAITANYVTGGSIEGSDKVSGIVGENELVTIVANYVNGTTLAGSSGLTIGSIVGVNKGLPISNFYNVNGIKGVGGVATDVDNETAHTNDIITNKDALNKALSVYTHEYVESGNILVLQPKATAPTLPSVDSDGYYLVDSADNLSIMRDYINLGNTRINIRLMENIDLNNEEWTPINSFVGIFDGNGKTISGLKVDTTSNNQGLFALTKGTIKHLGLISPTVTGGNNVGGIAGYNYATILASYVKNGTIEGTGENVGGIAGASRYNSITASYVITSLVKGANNVGGIVGNILEYTELIANYVSGAVIESTGYAGGIAGSINRNTLEVNYYHNSPFVANGIGNPAEDTNAEPVGSPSELNNKVDGMNTAIENISPAVDYRYQKGDNPMSDLPTLVKGVNP